MSNNDNDNSSQTKMKYRFLGNSGLLVSTFSFGSVASFGYQLDAQGAFELLEHAFKSGVNFFDNAEHYAKGKSEEIMGKAIQMGIERGVWTREDLVVSTKLYFGTKPGPNNCGLSRKHIVEGTKASLQRFGLDYVDLLFCHRPDEYTPTEEIVRAMNHVIDQGQALYWGTSEWSAAQIVNACEVADRLGLARPVFEQAQYNVFERTRVDYDFQTLYKQYGYGVTTWSPLYFGILTGKYNNGIPEGSRLSLPDFKGLADRLDSTIPKVRKLQEIADKIGCTMAQLALAWCASNSHVSTVILGATNTKQLDENLKALAFIDKITPEIKQEMHQIVQFQPKENLAVDDFVFDLRKEYL